MKKKVSVSLAGIVYEGSKMFSNGLYLQGEIISPETVNNNPENFELFSSCPDERDIHNIMKEEII